MTLRCREFALTTIVGICCTVLLTACHDSDRSADRASIAVTVSATVCDSGPGHCYRLGVPDATVIVSGAGRKLGEGRTDDGGHLTLSVNAVGTVQIEAISPLLTGGRVETTEAVGTKGAVSWT